MMNQKTKELIGYLINGLSMPLFIYLQQILETPDVLHSLKYLGWALIGCGVGLIALSTATLVRNRAGNLIESGIYGIVRHPMYLGAMLSFAAYVFFLPHWIVLLLVIVNLLVIYAFILQGDRQNIAQFGDAYERYMATVPRINLLAGIVKRISGRPDYAQ